MDRPTPATRDGIRSDTRLYEGAARVLKTGPAGTLAQGYIDQLNNGPVGNGSETRVNRFDANGRLLHQVVLKSDGQAKYDVDYTGYDNVGNVTSYTVETHGKGGNTSSYNTTYSIQTFALPIAASLSLGM